MLMYCIGGDDDCSSGDSCAGGGGGDDDADDDTAEEECACDDPIPCEMEAEYRERNPGFTITCDMFTSSGGSAHFSWAELNGFWAGGYESNHRPWGYISPGLPGHLEKVRVNYLAIEGNTATGLPLSAGTDAQMEMRAYQLQVGQALTWKAEPPMCQAGTVAPKLKRHFVQPEPRLTHVTNMQIIFTDNGKNRLD